MCHFAIIDENNDVFMVGRNSNGQLGLGDLIDRHIPVKLENIPKIISTGTGYRFTILLDVKGDVWNCGLLNLSRDPDVFPVKIIENYNIVKIACGENHVLLLDHEGSVFSFGIGCDYPKKIENIPKINRVYAGPTISLLIDVDMFCWVFGNNSHGQLGLGFYNDFISVPEKIPHVKDIVSASCGAGHMILIDSNGVCYSTGFGENGQLGLGSPRTVNIPTKIERLPIIVRVYCSSTQTYMVDIDGNVLTCGNIYFKSSFFAYYPTKIYGCDIVNIIGAENSVIFINNNGECLSFGFNVFGQLGLGDRNTRKIPEKIPLIKCKLKKYRFSNTKSARTTIDSETFVIG